MNSIQGQKKGQSEIVRLNEKYFIKIAWVFYGKCKNIPRLY